MADAFLQIAGIPGESTDSKHKNWIELENYSINASQTVTDAMSHGMRSTGRVHLGDFSFSKKIDSSSAKIFTALCKGQPIKKVVLNACRANEQKTVFLKIEMSNVYFTHYSHSGPGVDGAHESITFSPGQLVITYSPEDHNTGTPKGNIPGGWDQEKNKAITAVA